MNLYSLTVFALSFKTKRVYCFILDHIRFESFNVI